MISYFDSSELCCFSKHCPIQTKDLTVENIEVVYQAPQHGTHTFGSACHIIWPLGQSMSWFVDKSRKCSIQLACCFWFSIFGSSKTKDWIKPTFNVFEFDIRAKYLQNSVWNGLWMHSSSTEERMDMNAKMNDHYRSLALKGVAFDSQIS